MWYQAFEFYDWQSPATEGDMAAFRAPLPEAERADALRYLDAHAAQLQATAFCLPPHFPFPPNWNSFGGIPSAAASQATGRISAILRPQKSYRFILSTSFGITRPI